MFRRGSRPYFQRGLFQQPFGEPPAAHCGRKDSQKSTQPYLISPENFAETTRVQYRSELHSFNRVRSPRPGNGVVHQAGRPGQVPAPAERAICAEFCSSFSITSPTVKLATFCLGGNSTMVCMNCLTITCAGTKRKRRSATHLSWNIVASTSARSNGSLRTLNNFGKCNFTKGSCQQDIPSALLA